MRCNDERDSGEDDGEGESGDHDAGGDEQGQLLAGVAAAAVIVVSARDEGGDGGKQVEHYHGEGIPVPELWKRAGQEQEKEANRP